MEPYRASASDESAKVISPFADNEVAVTGPSKGKGKILLVVGLAAISVLIGAVIAVAAMRYINDPYRTLESFPVSKYLDGYQALAGSKYRASFRVEADLGWKDGTGRLMLFSTADDSRPIAVFVPAVLANGIYFTKGQNYIAEVEVKEGGLIYANSFQKN